MKVSFIFNNPQWSSIPQKVRDICAFFTTVSLEPTIFHTYFNSIPFTTVQTSDGHQSLPDTPGHAETVDMAWYTTNIVPLAPDADIVVLCITDKDIGSHITPIGIDDKTHIIIFGTKEDDHAYVNGIDQGNAFELFCEHELSHALYSILGKPDRTHEFFYSGNPTGVLPDFVLTRMDRIKMLIRYCLQALGLLKQLQNMQTIPNQPTLSKIQLWANGIAKWENARPESHNPGNMKYTTLTASWGATKGRPGADGGFFCQFPDDMTGMKALCNFLTLGCEDELKAYHNARTFEAFTKIYAGNPPEGYILGIAGDIGCELSTNISTFLN